MRKQEVLSMMGCAMISILALLIVLVGLKQVGF